MKREIEEERKRHQEERQREEQRRKEEEEARKRDFETKRTALEKEMPAQPGQFNWQQSLLQLPDEDMRWRKLEEAHKKEEEEEKIKRKNQARAEKEGEEQRLFSNGYFPSLLIDQHISRLLITLWANSCRAAAVLLQV